MKGRGVDFEHRFNTSRWAEDLLINSLDESHGLVTVRYGISTIVPQNQDLVYGLTKYKDPDLLVFNKEDLIESEKLFLSNGILSWSERIESNTSIPLDSLIKKAFAAIEVEFSPYKSSKMKDRHWQPRTIERWEKRPLKNATPPTAPNIWVKEEDVDKLLAWQRDYEIPICVVHLFDQEGFAIALNTVEKFRADYKSTPDKRVQLQVTSGIFAKDQRYDRIDAPGAAEVKPVFIITPAVAEKVGAIADVQVKAQLGLSSSMKYVSHIIFSEGTLKIEDRFLSFLKSLS